MSSTPKIRVLLADDNDILRSGLVVLIDTFDDLELVGEASTGIEAVDLCAQVQPDIVLMDLKMPDMDGVTATKIIIERFPAIQVIALTSFDEEPLVRSAKEAGIYGYLLKNVNIDTIANTIRRAYNDRKAAR